jgi:SAM-dependent methyltransferase
MALVGLVIPDRFVAAQLRRPSGRFGRWVMTKTLNRGNAEMIAGTLDALALRPNDRFLDLGFGGGLAIELAAGRTAGPLWGIDFSPDVVAAAGLKFQRLIRAGRLNLLCADVAILPLRAALVTAIASTNTIYFWPDPKRALESLRAVLEPGGRFALGYSGAAKMDQFSQITRHGFTTYEPDQVESLLREAGFHEVRTIAQAGRATKGDYVTLGMA